MKINRQDAGDNRQGAKDAKWGKEKSFPWRSWRLGGLNSGFTMVEIAISLAVIGIALVAIIGVLPIGMNTQRDNREETIINQDATVLMEAIRGGARGLDDLTNYVYAITNYQTFYSGLGVPSPVVVWGYNYITSAKGVAPMVPPLPINSGTNIVGLLSTPEYTDANGLPLPNLIFGGNSNHVVAYVRSISGPAVEKPPQNNDIIVGDSFGYRIFCVNAPVALDMPAPATWAAGSYNAGAQVYWLQVYWQATALTADAPGSSTNWVRVLPYAQELAANLHELRLTFLWPQQPNGSVGPGHQTFRTMVAGQIATNIVAGQILYFYQSQSFVNVTNAP
jgi:prepilin-type N-terminal cleavage/methylation domain-containing protein